MVAVDPVAGLEPGPWDLTPVQAVDGGYLKRDDLYEQAGVRGGKVRTCWALSEGAPGLVTAGSRSSPQVNIVAHVARARGIPCRVHVPSGPLTPELRDAARCGAELVQHRPGHNSVIVARARADARATGWVDVPFGMECREAVRQTSRQVANLPPDVRRIVVPVGSGMSLAGIVNGLLAPTGPATLPIVIGVVVGADPTRRLDVYAPLWRGMVDLVPAGVPYAQAVTFKIGGVTLDPHYEAKCGRYLDAGSLLWVVGIRRTAT